MNLDNMFNVLETVKYVFVYKYTHALNVLKMSSKLSRRPNAVCKIFRSLRVQLVRVHSQQSLTLNREV